MLLDRKQVFITSDIFEFVNCLAVDFWEASVLSIFGCILNKRHSGVESRHSFISKIFLLGRILWNWFLLDYNRRVKFKSLLTLNV